MEDQPLSSDHWTGASSHQVTAIDVDSQKKMENFLMLFELKPCLLFPDL